MTEFGFIDFIRSLFADMPDNGFEGIGDDCAVLPIGGGESLVMTSDLLAEGVHFLREATSPRELGRKSLAVNLSDVAAMGARPVATLLSLSLPADATDAWAEDFMHGYHELSKQFGVALIGGDTTRSTAGVTINVTAIGRTANTHLKRRNGAHVGDILFVAGELGASGAGLSDILVGHYDTPLANLHRNPLPQVDEGIWLGERPEVHAMMDLSDGLASDLRHILAQSATEATHAADTTAHTGTKKTAATLHCAEAISTQAVYAIGAEINLEQIPVAAGADLRTAACGGEDYKLLLSADPAAACRLSADFEARFGTPLYPIGRITQGREITWLRDGHPQTLDWQGFTHY